MFSIHDALSTFSRGERGRRGSEERESLTSTFSTFKEYGSFLLHRRKPRRFSIYLIQLCYLLGFVQPYSVPRPTLEIRRQTTPKGTTNIHTEGSLLSLLLSYLPQSNCTGSRASNNVADISGVRLPFDRRQKIKSRRVAG